MGQVSGGSRWLLQREGGPGLVADVVQLSCMGGGGGAHPGGGWGGSVSLRCHPPQQWAGIRLELTAEDIQLDCACHSVASIRAAPRAFVFAERRRATGPGAASFSVISIYVDLQLRTSVCGSDMLNAGVRRLWKSFHVYSLPCQIV